MNFPFEGIDRIARERRRQVEDEGWTAAHDDGHGRGQLATAGACYALAAVGYDKSVTNVWPWAPEWDKRPGPHAPLPERIRALEKAGALIAADLDRLLRVQEREQEIERREQQG